ncbi:hypothetical protein D9757_008764 [Collybiopsis confluens]|uniref:receptor protein-tyrosine kinase n=1 Tax=Collybiopsis confluens TaxID=2823264 RepID=A0A8H5H642_9AGAR|nr:hypothetical protein D9757_008764 [Collybiopsis confluens]
MASILVVAWIISLLSVPVRCADPVLDVPACNSQFNADWAFNSRGQSPCQVAGYLGSVCSDNTFQINSITTTEEYILSSQLANNCTCSTVYYNTLSACAICQGGGHLTWDQWAKNCSTVFLAYPFPIPDGTAVPQWAFQSSASSSFDPALAQQVGDVPESSAPPAPSGTATSPGSAPAATSPSTTSGSNGKSKAGAIAGGVVGGLAFVTIATILVFLLLRRRRRKGAVPKERQALDDDTAITNPTPFMVNDSVHYLPPMRVYNPSDSNTFPPTHGLMASDRTRSPDTQISALSPMSHYRSISDSTTGHYSGAAEI